MPEAQIHAFLQSVGQKFSIESGALQHVEETFTAISYPQDLVHPWPREFAYRVEFFTQHTDAEVVVPAIQQVLGSESREHVLSVFANEGADSEAAYGQFGYRLAWTNVLMKKKLSPTATAPPSMAGIRPISTARDVEAINALGPENLSSAHAIDDPTLHDFVAEIDGTLVAKAQMVTASAPIAYVSDMYTRPENRRMGLGTALLAHLHVGAAALGMEEMILVPSLMARRIGFYEKHGYQEAVPIQLFIPGR